jgi:hypothetical protein
MSTTHRMELQPCINCGNAVDAVSSLGGDDAPMPGNLAICVECGHIAIYDDNLKYRELTIDELMKISCLPEIMAAKKAAERFHKFQKENEERAVKLLEKIKNVKLVTIYKPPYHVPDLEWACYDENATGEMRAVVFGASEEEAKFNYVLALGSEAIDAALKHSQRK